MLKAARVHKEAIRENLEAEYRTLYWEKNELQLTRYYGNFDLVTSMVRKLDARLTEIARQLKYTPQP